MKTQIEWNTTIYSKIFIQLIRICLIRMSIVLYLRLFCWQYIRQYSTYEWTQVRQQKYSETRMRSHLFSNTRVTTSQETQESTILIWFIGPYLYFLISLSSIDFPVSFQMLNELDNLLIGLILLQNDFTSNNGWIYPKSSIYQEFSMHNNAKQCKTIISIIF